MFKRYDREVLRQYFFVIRELTAREIRRKYARSVLGILWSVLSPLLNMVVMSLIFSTMFKRDIINFPIYYLTGRVIWDLFSGATNSAMTALVDNKGLLIRTKIPKQVFIMSRVYTALTNFGYTMIAYVIMIIVFQVEPSFNMVLLLADIFMVMLFSVGISYILATAFVFFADIKHLYGVLLTLWMQLSAIFYPAERLPDIMQQILSFNPIYTMIYFARICVMEGEIPPLRLWLINGLSAVISFGLGQIVYRLNKNKIMVHI